MGCCQCSNQPILFRAIAHWQHCSCGPQRWITHKSTNYRLGCFTSTYCVDSLVNECLPYNQTASLMLRSIQPLRLLGTLQQISPVCEDIHRFTSDLFPHAIRTCSPSPAILKASAAIGARFTADARSVHSELSHGSFSKTIQNGVHLVRQKSCWKNSPGTLRSAFISPSPRKWPVPTPQHTWD